MQHWNFDIDRVSESREQCAAQAILVFQNSYLVNLGIGKRRAVCQFPFRLSVLRRPTTAPSPPIVLVVFLSRFVFGVTPFGDPWSLGTQLRGLTVPAGDFWIFFVGGRCVSVSFPACTFGKSDASFSIHPARSGNRSTVVQRHPLAQALSVLGIDSLINFLN